MCSQVDEVGYTAGYVLLYCCKGNVSVYLQIQKTHTRTGQESELTSMIVECCSQEKTFVSFYGLLGERFCRLNPVWANAFAQNFEETYKTIHRFETNRLRNIAKYYSHLLATDALDWSVFALVSMTEQDTTSSSRIFLKILLTDLVEALGLKKLIERFNDTSMVISVDTPSGTIHRGVFDGIFPKDHPKNTRFSINYFTSIFSLSMSNSEQIIITQM